MFKTHMNHFLWLLAFNDFFFSFGQPTASLARVSWEGLNSTLREVLCDYNLAPHAKSASGSVLSVPGKLKHKNKHFLGSSEIRIRDQKGEDFTLRSV